MWARARQLYKQAMMFRPHGKVSRGATVRGEDGGWTMSDGVDAEGGEK